ncbi:unnamed protein product [Rotaria magnacalcarata]|uniref:Uncharacterized protein n=1 Tax=Rotaria magnacalcarata TaxID=392030 RepID=A0A819WL62_9BILA|nr:unnamed protein product [Rotaria magnacalcarata]CAF4085230.1 unnamed protein product [Rotaria magnacalcarata]CAF4126369.1 unnamed protein product [Rotaria magnacalcarata]CAF5112178.1 unnamed protein product [Rotaria magnacalcarata]CAF5196446.1 unnamed protein product [Rotaria magnacalcarata]
MGPTEIQQSRIIYDNDSESMHTTLSQYQTPNYLAKPEEDDDDDEFVQQQQQSRNISSATRVTLLEYNTASAHSMLSKIAIAESGMT